ncbi:MAG: putative glycoside hydrolase [Clostridiaceae bacterium]|nr:putative glycoside hydrolase [Clostridiaceae bacterium]
MKMQKSYYRGYRGRKSFRENKLVIFSVIVFLVVLLALGFFIIPEYIVFTSDGFHFTFQKQDADKKDGDTAANDDAEDKDLNIVIDGKPSDDGSQTNPPTVSAMPDIAGVSDKIENLLKSSYASGLAKAAIDRSCNTLCFNIKDIDGAVKIPVTSAYASQGSQVENASQFKDGLELLKGDDIYLAARITALCDNAVPRAFSAGAVKKAGVTWLDKNKNSWIDPYSDMSAEYLSDIVKSCALAGFDAVIFDDLSFPTQGQLNKMEFSVQEGPYTRYEAIEKILATVKETADKEGIAVCVVLQSTKLENADAGQRVSEMAKYCHTIFYKGADSSETDSLLSSVLGDTGCRIGNITSDAFYVPNDNHSIIAGYLK